MLVDVKIEKYKVNIAREAELRLFNVDSMFVINAE